LSRLLHPNLALKFGLALFVIVAGALAIVYFAVVPRLESRLVTAKIQELERVSPSVADRFRGANPLTRYQPLATFFSSSLNARVVVLERLRPNSRLITVADSIATARIEPKWPSRSTPRPSSSSQPL
jgi:hypothetical protein